MTAGFIPHRQLVLVDLLAMIVAVRPSQRAVVAIDGIRGSGKTHVVGELLSLVPYVAGREVVSVSTDLGAEDRVEQMAMNADTVRREVLEPFRRARPELSEDAVLLVEGSYLRRLELAEAWDASLWLMTSFSTARTRVGMDRPVGVSLLDSPESEQARAWDRIEEEQRRYLQQARVHQPTWILDNSQWQRPHLLEPDPDYPQWFDADE